MSLRTENDALIDTETPNPDVLAGLQKAYLAAVTDGSETVISRIQFAWDYEVHGEIQSNTETDAEIRAHVAPAAEVITPELRAAIGDALKDLDVGYPMLVQHDGPGWPNDDYALLRAVANGGAS